MKDDKQFFKDFAGSFGAVFDVGLWLRGKGFEVNMPFPDIRPDANKRMEFLDSGDIQCVMGIEVKHRNFDFTCADDFKFQTIFLGDCYKVDRTFNRMLGYAIVSNSYTHFAWISRLTRPHWKTDKRYVECQNRECVSYVCPKELARYYCIKGS